MTDTNSHHRSIRSFVRREGRITRSQQRALDQLLPVLGLPSDSPIDPAAVYGRSAPLTLEIGFGNGDSLATIAEQDPAVSIQVLDEGQIHEASPPATGSVFLPVRPGRRFMTRFISVWQFQ